MRAYPRFAEFRPGADEEIVVPEEVSEAASLRPNAKRRKWALVAPEPSEEFEGLLVRVALMRPAGYDSDAIQVKITCSKDIATLCAHMGGYDQEHMMVVALSTQNEVRALYEVAVGGLAQSGAAARDIVKIPLLTGCPGIVVVHNHPSGNTNPSHEDEVFTTKLTQALKCMGFDLVDHIIVTSRGYTSMLDRGMM